MSSDSEDSCGMSSHSEDSCGEAMAMPYCIPAAKSSYESVRGAKESEVWRILVFGDGLTARLSFGEALADAFPPGFAEIWVCGLSGFEAADLVESMDCSTIEDQDGCSGMGLRRIIRECASFDLVIIVAGTLDLLCGSPPAPTATTIAALHTACHCEGVRTVATSVLTNKKVGKSTTCHRSLERVNELLMKRSGTSEGILAYFDLQAHLPYPLQSNDTNQFLWEDDGLCLSVFGMQHLARSMVPCLMPLRPQCIAPLPIPCSAKGGDMPQRLVARKRKNPNLDEAEPLRYLFYGDSLTAGFHAFGRLFAPYAESFGSNLPVQQRLDLWICGLSGLTAIELAEKKNVAKIKDVAKRSGPGMQNLLQEHGSFDLAFIMLGTNDLGDNEPKDIFKAIRTLHEECHAKGIRTVAMSVPPSRATLKSRRIRNCQQAVNAMLQEWTACSEATGKVLHANSSEFIAYDSDSELWEIDGLHFSPEGSRVLGSRLASFLANSGFISFDRGQLEC